MSEIFYNQFLAFNLLTAGNCGWKVCAGFEKEVSHQFCASTDSSADRPIPRHSRVSLFKIGICAPGLLLILQTTFSMQSKDPTKGSAPVSATSPVLPDTTLTICVKGNDSGRMKRRPSKPAHGHQYFLRSRTTTKQSTSTASNNLPHIPPSGPRKPRKLGKALADTKMKPRAQLSPQVGEGMHLSRPCISVLMDRAFPPAVASFEKSLGDIHQLLDSGCLFGVPFEDLESLTWECLSCRGVMLRHFAHRHVCRPLNLVSS